MSHLLGGNRTLRVLHFGSRLVRYSEGLALQESLAEQRKLDHIPDTLLVLQHSPVYTIGKRGREADFRVPVQELQSQGVDIHPVPRGGEVTYHGPGQAVLYPILNLRQLGRGARAYVEGVEDTVVSALGTLGISARGRVPGATGVWVQERKIAAIGVKISHGICSHGLALNVSTDLSAFSAIIPCGMPDKQATSVVRELSQTGGEAGHQHSPSNQGAEPSEEGSASAASSGSTRGSEGREAGLSSLKMAQLPTSSAHVAASWDDGSMALDRDNHQQVKRSTSEDQPAAGFDISRGVGRLHPEKGIRQWTPEHIGASQQRLLRLGVQALHEEVARRLVASLALQFGYSHLDVHLLQ